MLAHPTFASFANGIILVAAIVLKRGGAEGTIWQCRNMGQSGH